MTGSDHQDLLPSDLVVSRLLVREESLDTVLQPGDAQLPRAQGVQLESEVRGGTLVQHDALQDHRLDVRVVQTLLLVVEKNFLAVVRNKLPEEVSFPQLEGSVEDILHLDLDEYGLPHHRLGVESVVGLVVEDWLGGGGEDGVLARDGVPHHLLQGAPAVQDLLLHLVVGEGELSVLTVEPGQTDDCHTPVLLGPGVLHQEVFPQVNHLLEVVAGHGSLHQQSCKL